MNVAGLIGPFLGWEGGAGEATWRGHALEPCGRQPACNDELAMLLLDIKMNKAGRLGGTRYAAGRGATHGYVTRGIRTRSARRPRCMTGLSTTTLTRPPSPARSLWHPSCGVPTTSSCGVPTPRRYPGAASEACLSTLPPVRRASSGGGVDWTAVVRSDGTWCAPLAVVCGCEVDCLAAIRQLELFQNRRRRPASIWPGQARPIVSPLGLASATAHVR